MGITFSHSNEIVSIMFSVKILLTSSLLLDQFFHVQSCPCSTSPYSCFGNPDTSNILKYFEDGRSSWAQVLSIEKASNSSITAIEIPGQGLFDQLFYIVENTTHWNLETKGDDLSIWYDDLFPNDNPDPNDPSKPLEIIYTC